jgi:predicted RNA-binding Zn-ribbon protein involved in translation (DUF1610 family)
VYRCPYCGRAFKTFFALKIHVSRMHLFYCPSCGANVSDIRRHVVMMARRGDLKHKVLLALMSCHTKSWTREKNRELLKECTKLAMECCKVD